MYDVFDEVKMKKKMKISINYDFDITLEMILACFKGRTASGSLKSKRGELLWTIFTVQLWKHGCTLFGVSPKNDFPTEHAP